MTTRGWKWAIRFVLASEAVGLTLLLFGVSSRWFAPSRLDVVKPLLKEDAPFLGVEAEMKNRDLPFTDDRCPYSICRVTPLDDFPERKWLHLHFDSDGKLKKALILDETGNVVERLRLDSRN
jgi:hypothetical protein